MQPNIERRLNAKLRLFIVSIVVIFSASVSAAGAQQPHAELNDLARNFLLSHLNQTTGGEAIVDVVPLDKRVRLRNCDSSLQAFWPYEPRNFQNVSIGIRCTGSQPWKVYLQAKTRKMKKVAVLNAHVNTGDRLENSMISMRSLDILRLNTGSIVDYTNLIGREFTRNVRAGTPLEKRLLAVPVLVHRNEFVQIESGSGAIKVHAEGEALDDGYQGDTIKVKNNRSGKIVQATVIDRNTVRISR